MKPLVLFGAGELARLAYLAFADDKRWSVVACTVSAPYVDDAQLFDLPVVAWEDLETTHPAADHALFVAVGYRRVNRHRRELCDEARARGYELATYASPDALIASDVQLAENTFVLGGSVIEPFVRLGRNVIVWSGALIAHDSTIGDNCFLAPRATIAGNVTLGDNCFVGVNATVRDGVTVAPDCVIGAGAVVKHDTQPGAVYSAQPTPMSGRPSSDLDDL
jgi:sugar O-acyltransferase (sialic acid O-acetyltransferase NeuD family)